MPTKYQTRVRIFSIFAFLLATALLTASSVFAQAPFVGQDEDGKFADHPWNPMRGIQNAECDWYIDSLKIVGIPLPFEIDCEKLEPGQNIVDVFGPIRPPDPKDFLEFWAMPRAQARASGLRILLAPHNWRQICRLVLSLWRLRYTLY